MPRFSLPRLVILLDDLAAACITFFDGSLILYIILPAQNVCLYCVHRGLPVGIYETYDSNACHFVADNCKANIIVAENQTQLEKILEVSVTV